MAGDEVPEWRRKKADVSPQLALKLKEIELQSRQYAAERRAGCFGVSADELERAMQGRREEKPIRGYASQVRPAIEGAEELLRPMFGDDVERWKKFRESRKVVAHDTEDGQRYVQVISNVADALGLVPDSPALPPPPCVPRPRKYEVVQFLTDKALHEKFELTASQLSSLRTLAVVDCGKAAKKLQEHVRSFSGCEKATVSPGKYASSWRAAKDRVVEESKACPSVSMIVDVRVIGDKAFMYGPGDGEDRWKVVGMTRNISLMQCVHQIVSCKTPSSVMFALGSELTVLNIDIFVGDEAMCPVVKFHAGPHDEWEPVTSGVIKQSLSVDERVQLEGLLESLHTVRLDGDGCATAVRVSSQAVLVSGHIGKEVGAKTLGPDNTPLIMERMLSKDLWLARSSGPQVTWPLRAAVEGEFVFLAARRNNEIVLSDPVSVLSADVDSMVIERNGFMAPGASGAAVLSVRDFSLLGIYDGVTLRNAVAASFTPAMYTSIVEAVAEDVERHELAAYSTELQTSMKDRGLAKMVSAVVKAVVPLFDGDQHVGCGVCTGGKVYTTCNPDVHMLGVSENSPNVFVRDDSLYVTSDFVGDAVVRPPVVRSPSYSEPVFLVGKDTRGGYYSHAASRVVHVGVDSNVFTISQTEKGDLPLQGAVVLAKADAAVLGIYDSQIVDRKGRSVVACKAFPRDNAAKAVETRPAEVIWKLFPWLKMNTWPEGTVDRVVTHGSSSQHVDGGMTKLAMVGDAAIRTEALSKLSLSHLPSSEWQGIISKDQSNAAQSKICEDIGLHAALVRGKHVDMSSGSKVYADLLEALCGAVYLHDTKDNFEQLCLSLNMVRTHY